MTMQTIRPSLVPGYLRNSNFFLELNIEEDDEFAIPSNHMKLNTDVDTLADMTEFLNTIRFWGSEIFPQTMIDFAARQKSRDIKSVLEPYRADLPFIYTICSIASQVARSETRLERAMDTGNIDIVKYFHEKEGNFTSRAIASAAGKGALDCLQYAMCFFKHVVHDVSIFCKAVRNGHMDCILFLQQKGSHLHCYHCFHRNGVVPVDLAEIAALSGQYAVLKYLHSQGCSIRAAAIAAADGNHFDCLQFAMEKGARLRGENLYPDYSGTLVQRLARAGLLKFIPLALSRGGAIDAETTLNFARSRKWEMFKLCIQYITQPTLEVVFKATEKGYVECLQRLHEVCVSELESSGNGQNWLTYAASKSNPSSSHRLMDLAQSAATAKQWGSLKFLITHNCPMSKSLTTTLVNAEQLELYQLATAHGCEVSVQVACKFATDGNLRLLRHALEHGCERSEEILRAAARHGQLQCLKYAHAQGCPWSAQVTLAAARGGHRECLQYLNEQGCPMGARGRSLKRKRAILG